MSCDTKSAQKIEVGPTRIQYPVLPSLKKTDHKEIANDIINQMDEDAYEMAKLEYDLATCKPFRPTKNPQVEEVKSNSVKIPEKIAEISMKIESKEEPKEEPKEEKSPEVSPSPKPESPISDSETKESPKEEKKKEIRVVRPEVVSKRNKKKWKYEKKIGENPDGSIILETVGLFNTITEIGKVMGLNYSKTYHIYLKKDLMSNEHVITKLDK